VTIPWAKASGIVVITRELAQFSSSSAELLIRNDLVRAFSKFFDEQLVDPTVAAGPANPGALTNGVTPIPYGSDAFATAIGQMSAAGIVMRAPLWLLHTRSVAPLMDLSPGHRIEMATAGTIDGIRFATSPYLPVTSGTPDTTIAVFVEQSEILVADDGPLILDASERASLQLDSAPATPPTPVHSLWQENMVGIRGDAYHFWMPARDGAVQVVEGVPLAGAA